MASSSASSTSTSSGGVPQHVSRVRFRLNFRCEFGQDIAVVGSHCGWEPAAATPLSWNEGDWWSGEMELPLLRPGLDDGGESAVSGAAASSSSPSSSPSSSLSSEIEYKYIVRQGQHAAAWQPDSNFALRLGPIEKSEDERRSSSASASSSSSSSSPQTQEQQKRSLESCFLLLPSRVEVGDSWDGAVHEVTPVELVEIPLRSSPALPEEEEPLPLLSPAAAAEELQSALSAAVSALDEKKVSPASREALEADERVAEAAARASAAAAAVSKKRKGARRGLLRE